MNNLEKKMFDLLLSLKQDYGIFGIKSDFEAEGSRFDETYRLKELLNKSDIDLYVKIGGCEAVSDLYFCKEIGAKGIIAPMIDTSFAAQKFMNAAQSVYRDKVNDVDWIINTETKTSISNIDDILEKSKNFIKGLIVGRVDLSFSIGLDRSSIDSKVILDSCIYLSQKARENGLDSGFGGGITFNTIPFILKMFGLASKFESRKVIFRCEADENRLKKVIPKAMQFEMFYLKNKSNYNILTPIDEYRIKVMEERLKNIGL